MSSEYQEQSLSQKVLASISQVVSFIPGQTLYARFNDFLAIAFQVDRSSCCFKSTDMSWTMCQPFALAGEPTSATLIHSRDAALAQFEKM